MNDEEKKEAFCVFMCFSKERKNEESWNFC
jgi:hypothetical protein